MIGKGKGERETERELAVSLNGRWNRPCLECLALCAGKIEGKTSMSLLLNNMNCSYDPSRKIARRAEEERKDWSG